MKWGVSPQRRGCKAKGDRPLIPHSIALKSCNLAPDLNIERKIRALRYYTDSFREGAR